MRPGPIDHVRPRTLILLRHGESKANADDTFGGWLDVPLTERGRRQAEHAAKLLAAHGIVPDVVHTSLLSRAIETANIVLATLDRRWVPVQRSWRLNERHYGQFQGRFRQAARAELGEAAVAELRRAYDHKPPPLAPDDPTNPRFDARYAALPVDDLPSGESLADVRARLVPYWQDFIMADLTAGRVPLVVAHGNSLRALCMHLDRLSAEEVRAVEIPTGVPLRYDLDRNARPLVRGGTYLDSAT